MLYLRSVLMTLSCLIVVTQSTEPHQSTPIEPFQSKQKSALKDWESRLQLLLRGKLPETGTKPKIHPSLNPNRILSLEDVILSHRLKRQHELPDDSDSKVFSDDKDSNVKVADESNFNLEQRLLLQNVLPYNKPVMIPVVIKKNGRSSIGPFPLVIGEPLSEEEILQNMRRMSQQRRRFESPLQSDPRPFEPSQSDPPLFNPSSRREFPPIEEFPQERDRFQLSEQSQLLVQPQHRGSFLGRDPIQRREPPQEPPLNRDSSQQKDTLAPREHLQQQQLQSTQIDRLVELQDARKTEMTKLNSWNDTQRQWESFLDELRQEPLLWQEILDKSVEYYKARKEAKNQKKLAQESLQVKPLPNDNQPQIQEVKIESQMVKINPQTSQNMNKSQDTLPSTTTDENDFSLQQRLLLKHIANEPQDIPANDEENQFLDVQRFHIQRIESRKDHETNITDQPESQNNETQQIESKPIKIHPANEQKNQSRTTDDQTRSQGSIESQISSLLHIDNPYSSNQQPNNQEPPHPLFEGWPNGGRRPQLVLPGRELPSIDDPNQPPPELTEEENNKLFQQFLKCVESCPVASEYNPVCGSDGFTYQNGARLRCVIWCGANVDFERLGTCQPLRFG